LVLHDNLAYIAHVGDSRAYLIRRQKMIQLTNDQNISAAMMRKGEICPEDAQNHPQRNILTQSVGGRNLQPEVELVRTDIENEDKFLLCSDGLYSMLNDNEIMETICKHANLQSAAEALVKQANQKGGPDNITVMIIEI
ncbi:MAG: PP2C family protein-serine/threonine phosphatase, partial [Methanobacterium sp.]